MTGIRTISPQVGRGMRGPLRPAPAARTTLRRSMGIGFIPEDHKPQLDNVIPEDIKVPSSMFGLNPRQMLAMGIAGDDVHRLQQNITEVQP